MDPVETAIKQLQGMEPVAQLSYLFGIAYTTLAESTKALEAGDAEAAQTALAGCMRIMNASELSRELREQIERLQANAEA